MKCPVCTNVPLAIAERQGIEIDYCPTCRGVWLDRGELDKVIERADTGTRHSDARSRDDDDRYDDRDDDRDEGGMFAGLGRRKGRRRESMLGELFDFGG